MTEEFHTRFDLCLRLHHFVGTLGPAMIAREGLQHLEFAWSFGLAYWASGQVLMLLIPIFLELAASVVVAAVWNLYRPVSLFMKSLGLMLLPLFSRWVSEGRTSPEIRRRALRFAFLFGGAVFLYGLLLTLLAKPVLDFLYAGKYVEYWVLVGLFGISTVASTVAGMFILILKAQEDTRSASMIGVVSSIVTVVISFTPYVPCRG